METEKDRLQAETTSIEYDREAENCRQYFAEKIDHILIIAISSNEETIDELLFQRNLIAKRIEEGAVSEDYAQTFMEIICLNIVALIRFEFKEKSNVLTAERCLNYFRLHMKQAKELMQQKNHDYGEAWRHMRTSSMTDLNLVKCLRVKQIRENKGNTLVSEGIDANYYDIINYSIFALIKIHNES